MAKKKKVATQEPKTEEELRKEALERQRAIVAEKTAAAFARAKELRSSNVPRVARCLPMKRRHMSEEELLQLADDKRGVVVKIESRSDMGLNPKPSGSWHQF